MSRRSHISLTTKLAATLLELGHISRADARVMTADQIVALYQFDHIVLHAWTGDDHPANLHPMLIAEHREKSKSDTTKAAKTKRVEHEFAAFRRRMLEKAGYVPEGQAGLPKRKQKWGSRKLTSGNNLRRADGKHKDRSD